LDDVVDDLLDDVIDDDGGVVGGTNSFDDNSQATTNIAVGVFAAVLVVGAAGSLVFSPKLRKRITDSVYSSSRDSAVNGSQEEEEGGVGIEIEGRSFENPTFSYKEEIEMRWGEEVKEGLFDDEERSYDPSLPVITDKFIQSIISYHHFYLIFFFSGPHRFVFYPGTIPDFMVPSSSSPSDVSPRSSLEVEGGVDVWRERMVGKERIVSFSTTCQVKFYQPPPSS